MCAIADCRPEVVMVLSPNPLNANYVAVDFDPFAEGELVNTAAATESQREIWASVQMGDEANCAYNESQTLTLRGQLNVDALQAALQALVDRHGVLPISTVYNPSEGDGLHLNQHYLTPETLRASMSPEQLQGIATTAHTWYESHSLRENAKVFAQQFTLQPSPQSPQSA